MTLPAVPTDFPIPPDVEGFWAWEKGHFPRPATPLTQEILYRALTDGFSRAMQEWACPFGVECRAINYYAFLALRPFDLGTETVEERSARYQQILGKVLPRMGDLWTQEWLPAILPGLETGRTADYTALSNEELLHRLDEMLRDFRARWTIHGYVNFVVISASWFADFYNATFEIDQVGDAILRFLLLEIGRRLVRQGALADEHDVFLLYLAEIRAGLAGAHQQNLVAQRKAEMAAWARIIPPPAIGEQPPP